MIAENIHVAALDALLARARAAPDARTALAVLDAAPESVAQLSGWFYARSKILIDLGDYVAAGASAARAAALAPWVPEYRANLGAALVARARQTGERALLTQAIALLRVAAAQQPATAIVHNLLGIALDDAGETAAAIAAFDAALRIDPTFEPARVARAIAAAR